MDCRVFQGKHNVLETELFLALGERVEGHLIT